MKRRHGRRRRKQAPPQARGPIKGKAVTCKWCERKCAAPVQIDGLGPVHAACAPEVRSWIRHHYAAMAAAATPPKATANAIREIRFIND